MNVRLQKNAPILAAVLTVLFYGLYMFLFVRGHSGKLTYLVHAGSMLCDPAQVPANLYIHPHTEGYDGQFFYRLAIDPFTHRQTDHGMTIDAPPYRQQRIMVPLLAYILSLGQPLLVGKALAAINLMALAALAYVGALFARDKGQNPFWASLLALCPCWLVVSLYDTAEISSFLFLLTGLYFADRGRYGWAALWVTIAMLTRETSLIGAFSILAAFSLVLIYRRSRTPQKSGSAEGAAAVSWKPFLLVIPVVCYLLWTTYLGHVWGSSTASSSHGRFEFPLRGMLRAIVHGTLPNHEPYDPKTVFHMLYILAQVALGAWALRSSRVALALKICWAIFATMAVSFAYPMIYFYDVDYLRVLSEFLGLTAVLLITSPTRLKAGALAATIALDISFALDYFHRSWG